METYRCKSNDISCTPNKKMYEKPTTSYEILHDRFFIANTCTYLYNPSSHFYNFVLNNKLNMFLFSILFWLSIFIWSVKIKIMEQLYKHNYYTPTQVNVYFVLQKKSSSIRLKQVYE